MGLLQLCHGLNGPRKFRFRLATHEPTLVWIAGQGGASRCFIPGRFLLAMSRKIRKEQISAPSPLLPSQIHSFSLVDRKQMQDSKRRMDRSESLPTQVAQSSISPFTAGRFDASASVVGGPADPRTHQSNTPTTLTVRQYQNFCQAISVYRRQIQAMGAATETLVRALEELSDCVPAGKEDSFSQYHQQEISIGPGFLCR